MNYFTSTHITRWKQSWTELRQTSGYAQIRIHNKLRNRRQWHNQSCKALETEFDRVCNIDTKPIIIFHTNEYRWELHTQVLKSLRLRTITTKTSNTNIDGVLQVFVVINDERCCRWQWLYSGIDIFSWVWQQQLQLRLQFWWKTSKKKVEKVRALCSWLNALIRSLYQTGSTFWQYSTTGQVSLWRSGGVVIWKSFQSKKIQLFRKNICTERQDKY